MKSIIKDVIPPVIWRWTKKLLFSKKYMIVQQHGSEQSADFYDRIFLEHDNYKQHYTSSGYYSLWTIIADRISKSGAKSVLDIGCGSGQFALLLRDKGIRNYIGIDFSPERVKHAKSNCPDFDFIVADVYETDVFDVHDYDTVVCLEFLEHVERDLEVLERVRAGTKFFGTVPNFPYESHVRYFENSQKVRVRYVRKLRGFSIDTHLKNESGTKFFIMEGIIT